MVLILDAMAATGKKVSELADALPHYDIHKTKITLDRDRIPAALDALEQRFADATASRLDGLRLDWPDRWLLIRASNTEPIVRIIAEAPDETGSRKLCADAASAIEAD
jgi:phosphomannomutase